MWDTTDDYGTMDSSDDDISISSDDEAEILLPDKPISKKTLKQHIDRIGMPGYDKPAEEDEFEKIMNESLNETVQNMGIPTNCYDGASNSVSKIWNQSGSSLSEIEPSDIDLFYDPKMDDGDEAWVQQKLQSYQRFNDVRPKSSDAVLNCPACMSVLCLDCQRHERYLTQYRAMFVVNCKVESNQVLEFPVKKKSWKKRKLNATENYHPVKCVHCQTEVGVFDTEEVYHFFNVLASFS